MSPLGVGGTRREPPGFEKGRATQYVACVNCGHQHPQRPADDVCESCRKSFVVDLADPQPDEVLRAVSERPKGSRMGLVNTLTVIAVVGAVLVFATLVYLDSSGEEPPAEAPSFVDAGLAHPASPDPIQRVIAANISTAQRCFERALFTNPELAGECVLRWRIDGEGRVTEVQVVSSSLGDGVCSDCIPDAIRRWKFDAGAATEVTHPFVFQAIGF